MSITRFVTPRGGFHHAYPEDKNWPNWGRLIRHSYDCGKFGRGAWGRRPFIPPGDQLTGRGTDCEYADTVLLGTGCV